MEQSVPAYCGPHPYPGSSSPAELRGGLQGRQASVGSLITRNTCLPSALCLGRGQPPAAFHPSNMEVFKRGLRQAG